MSFKLVENLMDEETAPSQIIASFPKNQREAVCAGWNEWKGKKRLFVRIFTPTLEPGGALIPTREGISLPVEQAGELLEAVRALGKLHGEEDQVAARLGKSPSRQVWLGATTFKKIRLIYLRNYATFGDSEELKPTKQGISLRAEQYPKLLEIVEKLAEALKV